MKDFYLNKLLHDIHTKDDIKSIRATRKFVGYISVQCRYDVSYKCTGDAYVTYLVGIPIVVDDNIASKYYELEF